MYIKYNILYCNVEPPDALETGIRWLNINKIIQLVSVPCMLLKDELISLSKGNVSFE